MVAEELLLREVRREQALCERCPPPCAAANCSSLWASNVFVLTPKNWAS
jgi:hypothetical protein